jgi:hypothetical protein
MPEFQGTIVDSRLQVRNFLRLFAISFSRIQNSPAVASEGTGQNIVAIDTRENPSFPAEEARFLSSVTNGNSGT